MSPKELIYRIAGKAAHLYYERRAKGAKAAGRVLMMHKIGDESAFSLSTEAFSRLLNALKGKNVIRLEDWKTEHDFVALTFDDVAESFYLNAFPLLKQYGYPFTIFVALSLLDTPGFISTAQLQELAACELCTVGSHGISHSYFSRMTKTEVRNELQVSKERLEKLTGKKIDMFAFPYGSFYACGFGKRQLVAEVYEYGFGTVNIPITEKRLLPNYFLPRINVDEKYISSLCK